MHIYMYSIHPITFITNNASLVTVFHNHQYSNIASHFIICKTIIPTIVNLNSWIPMHKMYVKLAKWFCMRNLSVKLQNGEWNWKLPHLTDAIFRNCYFHAVLGAFKAFYVFLLNIYRIINVYAFNFHDFVIF